MQLEIITPDQNLYNGEANSIVFPGKDGSFGVLNNHAPMIATLKRGTIEINGGSEKFDVNGGVVEVLKNKVIVLVD